MYLNHRDMLRIAIAASSIKNLNVLFTPVRVSQPAAPGYEICIINSAEGEVDTQNGNKTCPRIKC